MNILILNSILFTAEAGIIPAVSSIKDTMIYNMALGFLRLGHSVTIAAAEDFSPTQEENYDCEVLFFKSDLTPIFKPTLIPLSSSLHRYIKANHSRFDMILSSEVFSFQSLYAAMSAPRKTVIWQEMVYHQRKFHKLPSRLWYNIIAPLCYRNVNSVIPRSTQAHDFVAGYCRKTVDDVVDHGINAEKFKSCETKQRWLITSSQLIKRKRVDRIIRKFAELHRGDRYADITLLIAGRGPEEENLKELTRQLGIADNVKFLGFLPQHTLNDYVKQSLCFLIDTERDLNMVSIPEAIVSGTPILTNTVPASAGYINAHGLGIARDNWGNSELSEIIDNNSEYVSRCIAYRDNLTNDHACRRIIEIFNRQRRH